MTNRCEKCGKPGAKVTVGDDSGRRFHASCAGTAAWCAYLEAPDDDRRLVALTALEAFAAARQEEIESERDMGADLREGDAVNLMSAGCDPVAGIVAIADAAVARYRR